MKMGGSFGDNRGELLGVCGGETGVKLGKEMVKKEGKWKI